MQTGVPSRALCCLFSLMQIYSFWNSRKSGKQTFKMVMWLKSEPVPLTVRFTHSTFSSFAFLFPYFFVLLGIYWISVWYLLFHPSVLQSFQDVQQYTQCLNALKSQGSCFSLIQVLFQVCASTTSLPFQSLLFHWGTRGSLELLCHASIS